MATSGDGVTARPGAAREAERAPIIYFQRSGSLSPDTRSGGERRKGYDAAAFLSRKAKIDAKYGTRNKGIRRIADRHRQELAEHTQRTQQTYQPLPVAPPVEAKRYTRSYGDGVKVQVEDARRVERRKVIGADPHGPLRRKDGADGKSVNTGRRSTDTNRRAAVPAPEPDGWITELRRRVAALPLETLDGKVTDWATSKPCCVHVPSLLRALGDTGSGR